MINDQIGLGLLILVIGFAVVLPLVYWWSTRQPPARDQRRIRASNGRGGHGREPRIEPVMGGASNPADGDAGISDGPGFDSTAERGAQDELSWTQEDPAQASTGAEHADTDSHTDADTGHADPAAAAAASQPDLASLPEAARSDVGARPNQSFERIVSLFVRARGGHLLRGDDVMVVAQLVRWQCRRRK